jgi:deoxynucleoside kinase
MTNEKRPFTVLVEGNIGCGKTTFLDYFASSSTSICKESVSLWQNVKGHNLLKFLYNDPTRWAALFQSYVMLTGIQNFLTPSIEPVKIYERSLFSAQYCFAENFYRTKKIHEAEYQVLSEWHKFLTTNPKLNLNVDLIVYLRIQPEKALERIKSRARGEEINLSLDYLQELHDCHDNWLLNHKFPVPAPVLVIDANKNMSDITIEYIKYQDVILGRKKLSL